MTKGNRKSEFGRRRDLARSRLFPVSNLRSPVSAFTLFEVILSLMILALLTGAVYSITSAATETSRATMRGSSPGRHATIEPSLPYQNQS